MVAPARQFGQYLNGPSYPYPTGFPELIQFKEMLGRVIELPTNAAALQVSKTSIGTLRRGKYMWVRSYASGTATPARGNLAFIQDFDNHVVSADGSLANDGKVAGVFLGAVTKGDGCWIQIEGDCSGLYRASVTNKTDGNIVLGLTADNVLDAIADATGSYISGGAKGLKSILGVALEAPDDGSIKRFLLKFGMFSHRSPAV